MEISVAVADDATEHAELLGAEASDEESLVVRDVRDLHGFDTDEDQDLVKCGEIGGEVAENGWQSGDHVSVDETDARDPDHAQTGPHGEDSLHGDLVFEVELVFL